MWSDIIRVIHKITDTRFICKVITPNLIQNFFKIEKTPFWQKKNAKGKHNIIA